jgi:hypothetical protein
MSRSNLIDAVAAIDRCSEDELRQIQALIGVRLGDRSTGSTRGSFGKKADGGKGAKGSKPASGKGKPKGNPNRKSQFATHPVYKMYKEAKAAVDAFCRTEKIPFKDVSGDLRRAYEEALSNWLQTKSGFRNSKKDHENSDLESEEAKVVKRGGSNPDGKTANRPTDGALIIVGKSDDPSRKRRRIVPKQGSLLSQGTPGDGKYSDPPEWWTADGQKSWKDLDRKARRSIWNSAPNEMEEGS